MIDFSWPKEYIDYKDKVAAFASKLDHNILELDGESQFPAGSWNKCAEFGLLGLSVESSFGGTFEKVDFLKAMLAMEGFGYGCRDNGLALALNAQMWTVQHPIAHFGSDQIKSKYLPKLVSGKMIGCHALTEPEAGSDAYSMSMTAKKVENGYVLNGTKKLISLGPIADLVLVFAITDSSKGRWGISAFIVEKGTKGFVQHETQKKMGLRTVPIGRLSFEDCFVSDENLIGAPGSGYAIMNHSLEYDRCCILASHIGAMERQLEETVRFVKNRKQFNQSVSKFQSVSNRVVDMKLRLETSKLLLYKVAWLKSKGKNAVQESALLKLYISENFVASSLDAIRSHGGDGYLSEFEIERDFRDAVGGILYAGTSDIQRNIIASMMGL